MIDRLATLAPKIPLLSLRFPKFLSCRVVRKGTITIETKQTMMHIWDVAVEGTHLEHRASLVEIELDSRGQLLLLQTEILSERGGERDGALRDGLASSQAPPASGIPTDLPKSVGQTQSSLTTIFITFYHGKKHSCNNQLRISRELRVQKQV